MDVIGSTTKQPFLLREFNRGVCVPALSLALLGALFPNALTATPGAATVTNGVANIDTTVADTVTINQTSDQIAIEWQGFNLDAGDLVQYIQPTSSALALNIDISGALSQIDGALLANGNVFIFNTAGLLFGANAQIQVNGLLASDLSPNVEEFFETGELALLDADSEAGGITNAGAIRAGDGGVVLASQYVVNQGTIGATRTLGQQSGGNIALVAASGLSVVVDSNTGIGYEVTLPIENNIRTTQPFVENQLSGQIETQGNGSITLQAVYSGDALVDADSAILGEGRIGALGLAETAGGIFIIDTNEQENPASVAIQLESTISDTYVTGAPAVAAEQVAGPPPSRESASSSQDTSSSSDTSADSGADTGGGDTASAESQSDSSSSAPGQPRQRTITRFDMTEAEYNELSVTLGELVTQCEGGEKKCAALAFMLMGM